MYIKNKRNSCKFKAFGSYKALCLTENLVLKTRNKPYTNTWRLIAQGLAVHDKISHTKGSCTLGNYRNRMATLQNRFKSDCKSKNQGSGTDRS